MEMPLQRTGLVLFLGGMDGVFVGDVRCEGGVEGWRSSP